MKKMYLSWLVLVGVLTILILIEEILSGIDGIDVSVISAITKTFLVIWLIATLIIAIGIFVQSNIRKKLLVNKSIEEKIIFFEELNKNKWKLLFVNIEWENNLNLGVLHLMKSEINVARSYLDSAKKSGYSLYPRLVIAAYDNDLNEATKLFNDLNRLKGKRFVQQKHNAKMLIDMMTNSEYNDELFASSNYQVLKDICLRYKNDCL